MATAVFDAHSHCFPPMASSPEFDGDCLKEIQYHVRFGGRGFRRVRDNALLDEPVLLGDGDGVSWLPEVDFRIGRFGRVEFTYKGEDYYYQFLPPTLFDMSSPPEYITTQMDYAGVDRAVLHHDRVYGRMDDYLGECARRFPDRLVALAQVDEWVGGRPDQLARLRRQIEELGFSGLYFSTGGFFHDDFKTGLNDPGLEPLWDLVAELGIPVHWYATNNRRPRLQEYLNEITEFTRWARAHPHITSVLTHGLENLRIAMDSQDRFSVPSEIMALIELPNWHIELMLHKMSWDSEFPPYNPDLCKVVRTLVEHVGVEKLLWGSDMPSCEQVVTYRQSMVLYETQCAFLTPAQRAAILGGNLERLYPL